jgi:hypothetical protein
MVGARREVADRDRRGGPRSPPGTASSRVARPIVHVVADRDWWDWHRPYDDPGSPLSYRLAVVTSHLRVALDQCEAGPIRIISMCAGQGRDVISVVADHPRGGDVRARLVELDPRNVEHARRTAAAVSGAVIDVHQADAGTTDAYLGAVPAQIVLACGVFGNITDDDIHRTVLSFPALCARDATVIWTRHRRPPDLTPIIRDWFEGAGFEEVAFSAPGSTFFGVGAHRFVGEPRPPEVGKRMFTFVGFDQLLAKDG